MNIIRKILLLLYISLIFTAFSDAFSEDLNQAINKGIGYLYNHQMLTGEFPTFISDSPDFITYQPNTAVSPYITSYILYHLSFLSDTSHKFQNDKLDEINTKGLNFLTSLALPPGLWQFEASLAPDIDNTSCALIPFILNDMDRWEYHKLLDAIEKNSDYSGLLLTFFRSHDKKEPSDADYDISVYSNVLLLYGLLGKTHQPTLDWMNHNIPANWSNSLPFEINKWAIEPLTPAYLVSRAYKFGGLQELEPSVKVIQNWLLPYLEQNDNTGNPQHLALILLTAMNLDIELSQQDNYIKKILDLQKEDGSWEPATFFMDFKPRYYGSPALSTALYIEAIWRYSDRQ